MVSSDRGCSWRLAAVCWRCGPVGDGLSRRAVAVTSVAGRAAGDRRVLCRVDGERAGGAVGSGLPAGSLARTENLWRPVDGRRVRPRRRARRVAADATRPAEPAPKRRAGRVRGERELRRGASRQAARTTGDEECGEGVRATNAAARSRSFGSGKPLILSAHASSPLKMRCASGYRSSASRFEDARRSSSGSQAGPRPPRGTALLSPGATLLGRRRAASMLASGDQADAIAGSTDGQAKTFTPQP